MTIEHKARVALAIIKLAPPESSLFRGAAALRSQLAAAIEYELGVTSAAAEPPRTRF